jgi:hypothetical protein
MPKPKLDTITREEFDHLLEAHNARMQQELQKKEAELLKMEQLLSQYENALDEIEAPQKEKRGWRAIVGTFENDSLYDEAMQKGREWRESRESQHEEAQGSPSAVAHRKQGAVV